MNTEQMMQQAYDLETIGRFMELALKLREAGRVTDRVGTAVAYLSGCLEFVVQEPSARGSGDATMAALLDALALTIQKGAVNE